MKNIKIGEVINKFAVSEKVKMLKARLEKLKQSLQSIKDQKNS